MCGLIIFQTASRISQSVIPSPNSELYPHHRNNIKSLIRCGAGLGLTVKGATWISHIFSLLGNSILLGSLMSLHPFLVPRVTEEVSK